MLSLADLAFDERGLGAQHTKVPKFACGVPGGMGLGGGLQVELTGGREQCPPPGSAPGYVHCTVNTPLC